MVLATNRWSLCIRRLGKIRCNEDLDPWRFAAFKGIASGQVHHLDCEAGEQSVPEGRDLLTES